MTVFLALTWFLWRLPMTARPLSNRRKSFNLDNITYVENSQWHLDGDPHKPLVDGITVHFIGGSAVRLLDCEAAEIVKQFGLA
jgi:hypothetical protein